MLKDLRFTIDDLGVRVYDEELHLFNEDLGQGLTLSRKHLAMINEVLADLDAMKTKHRWPALPAPAAQPPQPPIREAENAIVPAQRPYQPPAKPASPSSYGPDEPNREHPLDKAMQPPEPSVETLITLDGVLQNYLVIELPSGNYLGSNDMRVSIEQAQLFADNPDTRQRAAVHDGTLRRYSDVGLYRVMYIDMLTRDALWLVDAGTGATSTNRSDGVRLFGRASALNIGNRHIPSADHRMHVVPVTGAA